MMVYKIILSDFSFFYLSYVETMDIESIDNSDDFMIVFYNFEKEPISQVFFSKVKGVFEVHYDSIEPYYKDVTDELRCQCKSSRGGASGDIVRPPFGDIVFSFDDYILRFFEILVDIGIYVSLFVLLMFLLKNFLGGICL